MTPADLVKRHEGFRRLAYDDASGLTVVPGRQVRGNISVGWGRNLIGEGVSGDEADVLLDNDVARCVADLTGIFGDAFANADPARQAALVDIRYNVGPEGFRRFPKMIAAVKAGDWNTAADECLNSNIAPIRARDDAELLRNCALP